MTTCAGDQRRSWLACFFIHAAILFWATSALGADLTWTGAVSTDWTNSANWNPQQVPTAGDHVVIASGNITIPASAAFGSMDWSGGNIYGSLLVPSNIQLNITGSGLKQLLGPLTNSGNVVLSGAGQLQVVYAPPSYYGVIYNQSGGLFDLQSEAMLNDYNGNELFNNAGLLRKSGGTGTTTFHVPLSNTGIVLVQSGTLTFADGGSLGGQFTAGVGATLLLSGGNFVQSGAPIFSGVSQLVGGNLTLVSDVIPGLALNGGTLILGPGFQGGSITNLTLAGSTLSGTNTVSGILNWGAGMLVGALTVSPGGVCNINGSSMKQLVCPLTNAGNVVLSGPGQLQVIYAAPTYYGVIYNQAGALFDLQSDALLNDYSGNEVFNNAGILRKSGGSGTTTFNVPLSNTGIVQVQSGTLALANGGSLAGQFTASAGTTLLLNGGNFVQSGTPIFSGPGLSQLVGGNLTLNSDAIPGLALNGGTLILGPGFQGGSITNLTLTGSTMSGTNTVRGVLNWEGGMVGGALTVATNGVLNISGSFVKQLLCPLTNAGNVVLSGAGQLQVVYAAPTYYGVIYNQAGALFDLQSDALLNNYSGNELFDNAGSLRKSGGGGTSTINLQLHNAALVQVQSGTLAFADGGSLAGQFTAGAGTTLLLSGGNFVQSGTPLFSGVSQFVGGNLTLVSDVIPGLALNGGTLILGPGFQGGSITNLTLTGSTLSGTNTVRGMLNWEAGVIYGALTVANNGVIAITGSSLKQLLGSLTNSGNVVWTGSGEVQVVYAPTNYYGAIYNQSSALFDLQSDAELNNYSGNEVFNNAGRLRKSGGTGVSAINLGLNNSGTVEADMGIVYLYGAYTSTGNPNLSFSLGGASLGAGYGQIVFAGQLVLSGSLTATTRNAYRPNPGDSFHVLNYASVTGAPGCLALDLGGGLLLQPQFGATAMNLVVTTYPTNATFPTLSIALAPGGLLLTWPLGFPGWSLQGTTNLSSHVWTPIPTPCGNQALVPGAVPRQYFRLVSSN